jgi:hypothetical protein
MQKAFLHDKRFCVLMGVLLGVPSSSLSAQISALLLKGVACVGLYIFSSAPD